MNYSTLLQRSTDWDTYKAIFDPAYPDPTDHVLTIGIVQMLWDRGEANGYTQHSADPATRIPDTPNHQVLIHEAFGDHQVANVATEVEARSSAPGCTARAADGRSSARHQLWGMEELEGRYDGSAIVVGTAVPRRRLPATSLASGRGPARRPARRRKRGEQKSEFLKRNGRVVDVCGGQPCTATPTP